MTTMDWRAAAACRGTDTELFFPVSEFGPGAAQVAEAKALCAECPVREDCLTSAYTQEFGVWGGTTATERKKMRAAELTNRAQSG